MENTLLIGDHVFVDRMMLAPATKWIDKLIPYREPRHGDIFVFISPASPGSTWSSASWAFPATASVCRTAWFIATARRLDEPYVVRPG